MKQLIIATAVFGLLGITPPASAEHWGGYERIQQRLAKIQEERSTYLPRKFQTANVFDYVAGPGLRKGAAWMVRSRNTVKGRIMSNVPTAGDPYTLWVVLFNNPGACATDVCGEADLANPDTRFSVFNGSGAISASNGKGGGVVNMDFELIGGNLADGTFILFGEGQGLRRNFGRKAQINLVIDQHPSITPGADSWIPKLTETNFPGAGPATNNAVALFLPCAQSACPDSVL